MCAPLGRRVRATSRNAAAGSRTCSKTSCVTCRSMLLSAKLRLSRSSLRSSSTLGTAEAFAGNWIAIYCGASLCSRSLAPRFAGDDSCTTSSRHRGNRVSMQYISARSLGNELHLERRIKTLYIKAGSPWENGHIESFHDKLRDECLNQELFWHLGRSARYPGELACGIQRGAAAQIARLPNAG